MGIRKILATALRTVESRLYRGVGVATVAVRSKGYVPGLAAVVEELLELTAADVLIMACEHQNGLDLIGRARPGAATVDLRTVMSKFGGGGHARAAAAAVPENDRKAMGAPRNVLDVAREYVLGQIPAEPTAAAIMTSSVVTLKDDATIADARRLLNAHSLKATAVVDAKGRLRGVLKMSDVSKLRKLEAAKMIRSGRHAHAGDDRRRDALARLEEILVTTVGRVPGGRRGRLLGRATICAPAEPPRRRAAAASAPAFRRGGARVNRAGGIGALPSRRAGRAGRFSRLHLPAARAHSSLSFVDPGPLRRPCSHVEFGGRSVGRRFFVMGPASRTPRRGHQQPPRCTEVDASNRTRASLAEAAAISSSMFIVLNFGFPTSG